MQVALLLLFLVVFSIIIFLSMYHWNNKDGFVDIDEMHSNYVTRQEKQWGDVGISLIPNKKDGSLGDSANNMLKTVGEKGSWPLNTERNGLWKMIDKCESIKTMDCNAFDDPEFSTNCGLCLDIGENSENAKSTGGLVLLPDDKKIAKDAAHSNFLPDYKPTIGFCPAKKMVATKEECLQLQRELLCQKNSSYDLPGCSQCYSDTNYSIVDPKTSPGVIASRGTILFTGIGRLRIQEQDFGEKNNINLNENNPYSYDVRGNEGARIKLFISPPANSDPDNPTTPYLSASLVGDTTTGTFGSDLRRIVLVDEVTGRKPRSRGKNVISGTTVTKMAPGFGQSNAVIVVIIPFSFAETTTSESTMCKDGPFVTTQAAAEFLESDPCYKKGSGPGKYNLECLQGAWDSNGCNESGKGYPKDTASASDLMTGSDGSFLSINDISDFVYNKALITATGVDENGNKMKIKDWSAASVFCTGQEITSPCDVEARNRGPLPVDCLQYLWNNEGAKEKRTGPTYNLSNIFGLSFFDVKKMEVRGCQTTGTLSPIDSHGNKNQAALQFWKNKGGVNAVKSVMNNIHATANAKGIRDEQRMEAFNWCYGPKQLAQRPPTIEKCAGNMLPKSYKPTRGQILRRFNMAQDYKLEFDIIIKSNTGTWGSVLYISQSNFNANGNFGDRTPGIWVVPNNWGGGGGNLHVRIGDATEANWGFDSLVGCTIGKKSHFSLECNGDDVTVKIDSKTYTMKQPTYRYSGPVIAYSGDPAWFSANAVVWNVCLQLGGNSRIKPCPSSLLPTAFIPTRGQVLARLNMTQDYKLEFDIIPKGIVGGWGSIFHFTSDGNNCCNIGWRTPAIWLWPGGLGMHVRIGDPTDGNWGMDDGPNHVVGLEIGKKSHFSLECNGTNVTVKLDSRTFTKTQPTYRYSGPVMVYGTDPWHDVPNCSIFNVCLTTAGNSTKITDVRQDMSFNNVNINGAGAAVSKYLGNFPDIAACAAAGRKAQPTGNYGVTWGGNEKQCWVVGPMNPYDKHFNPHQGWTSTYFRPPGERLAGIPGVTRVQLAGSGAHDQNLNFSQLVVLDDLGRNISRGRPTEGSGQWGPQTHSGRAVDGGEWPRGHPDEYHDGGPAKNITHWEVKLDGPSTVSAIIIYNRADCCQHRLGSKNMHFFNSAGDLIYWKPTMGTGLVYVLPTNSSTNQAAQTKNNFNAYCYSNRYKDLYNAFDAPNGPGNNSDALVNHYNNHGRGEGRNPNC